MKRTLIFGVVVSLCACGGETPEHEAGTRPVPAVEEAQGRSDSGEARRVVYVDVRQPDEWAAGHVEGAIHIPHTELSTRWTELEEHRDAEIVLYCRTGRRSGIAEEILRQAGFERLQNGGGLSDLERQGLPVVR